MNFGKVRHVGSLVLASLGACGAALQAGLLMTRGKAICLNEGCRIIEGLTRVPPLFINLAGGVFFLIAVILIWCGPRSKFVRDLLVLILLAGVAAEGVLFSFQYFVAKAFCVWCLSVFAIVVLLNLLAGIRQSLKATAIFMASFFAFAALSFGAIPHLPGKRALDRGTWGVHRGTEPARQLYLIFSWSCPHCAEVIRALETCDRFNYSLNPIDKDAGQKLAGVEALGPYEPEVSRQFLSLLGIDAVPVLLVTGLDGLAVVSGGKKIGDYIRTECSADKPVLNGFPLRFGAEGLSLPVFRQDQDSCDATEPCPPVSALFPGK